MASDPTQPTAETRYVVAVWWRMEGYGGGTDYETPEQATEAAKRLLSQGYGDGQRGHGDEVRVRKVTTETWTVMP